MDQVREQRKDRRYQTRQRTLARLSTAPDVLFHVIDISCGGLAFRYLGDHKLNEHPGELDIHFGDNCTLSNLPVTSVSDAAIEYGYIPMRRRGLQFTDLSPGRKAELDHFLANCTAVDQQ
ncbi:PilZ domain-containing protein [Trichloromonas sp.]|uniref:PilZ domain-containing protein n=1 Tax=Trichloromonas sp. TaxID=3069249 RepID=UPI003D8130EA